MKVFVYVVTQLKGTQQKIAINIRSRKDIDCVQDIVITAEHNVLKLTDLIKKAINCRMNLNIEVILGKNCYV